MRHHPRIRPPRHPGLIPALPGPEVLVRVAQDLNGLRDTLRVIAKLRYCIKLNPAWTVPNF